MKLLEGIFCLIIIFRHYPLIFFFKRRNISPSSFDGDGERGSPRSHRHPLKPHPFELPVGSVAERSGKAAQLIIIDSNTLTIYCVAALPHNLHKHQVAGNQLKQPVGKGSTRVKTHFRCL